jgi:hypothetical protein
MTTKSKKVQKTESESKIQLRACDYLKQNYPDAVFTFDAGGFALPIGYAMKVKRMRSGNGIPDLIIFNPNFDGTWHGLMIEIKKDDTKIMTKKGTFASDHLKEQADMLLRLEELGYKTLFACGYDEVIEIIDDYFMIPNN